MGIYRLVLAIAVMLSHVGIMVFGKNIGVIAVVSFFLLSGYVMTALIDKNYSEPYRIPMFYLDRMMRLFPQFAFYMLLTLVLIRFAHPASPFLSQISHAKMALNLSMVPLNFFRYFPHSQIIPQAWSLGLESQFYIVVPLIVIFAWRAQMFALSAAFFLLPYFGVLDSDTWGYRMLPATLFMFLFGSFLYRHARSWALFIAYGGICSLFAIVAATPSMQRPFDFEVLFGLVIGAPVVWILSNIKSGKIDEVIGNLSYGVFLNHFFLIWTLQVVGIEKNSNLYLPILIASSIALAALSYAIVERPSIRIRHTLRKRISITKDVALQPLERVE
jgi:peptidoglycan/LPS O-acetylase OafA/YrhL